VQLENVRAIVAGGNKRRVSFTPATSGKISLSVMEAGADSDYAVSIADSDKGLVADGKVVVDIVANSRLALEIGLTEEFKGALKVVAHEV
jgi:hypothetical protein